jgi:hypothetical protein
MKRLTPALLLGTAFLTALTIADAQPAKIQYAPAVGTKTKYQTVTVTSAQILDFATTGATAAQQEQAKTQLQSAASTRTVIDSTETVAKIDPDGSRRVNSALTMTITTGASATPLKAGFNSTTLYRTSGTAEIERFILDKTRTSENLIAPLQANAQSFKNIFSQSNLYSFYGKSLSDQPTEVISEIPAPAMAANLNLKYRTRTQYTLLGRSPSGGYRIGVTTQLEPVNYSGTQQGTKISLKIEAMATKGEISLLPDGRIERAAMPSDLTVTTNTSAASGSLRYSMRVKTSVETKIVQ